jgi:hypothetical protein
MIDWLDPAMFSHIHLAQVVNVFIAAHSWKCALTWAHGQSISIYWLLKVLRAIQMWECIQHDWSSIWHSLVPRWANSMWIPCHNNLVNVTLQNQILQILTTFTVRILCIVHYQYKKIINKEAQQLTFPMGWLTLKVLWSEFGPRFNTNKLLVEWIGNCSMLQYTDFLQANEKNKETDRRIRLKVKKIKFHT